MTSPTTGRSEADRSAAAGVPDVVACVFGPSLFATVTVEHAMADTEIPELHFHPGGQAFWIARAATQLGVDTVLVSPVGGEAGVVLSALMPMFGVELVAVATAAESPAYVHDRRDGDRREIARSPGGTLSRHDIDDLYGRVLELSATTKLCVVTGSRSGRALGDDFYHRLGSDLAALGVSVVGDLHGPELDAFLDGGGMSVLKVSHQDLVDDGRVPDDHDVADRIRVADELQTRGAEVVVVSDPGGAVLLDVEGRALYGRPPRIEPVDSRGAGDAMTAALCLAHGRGDDTEAMLRFACGAGAATVARHGLGNAERYVIDALTSSVDVTRIARDRGA